jgi:hypothetical protein
MFDTYGPFKLAKHDKDGIDDLYRQIQTDETVGLQFGIGIYIIATQDDPVGSIPLYVGMTTREFGARLIEHLNAGKFSDLVEDGPLQIHLIALTKDGRIHTKDEANEKQKLAIEQLEYQLINHCAKLNKNLLNVKRWSANQVHVPGFIDDGDNQRDFPAARALAKLLKT